jgi:hypothetical protein
MADSQVPWGRQCARQSGQRPRLGDQTEPVSDRNRQDDPAACLAPNGSPRRRDCRGSCRQPCHLYFEASGRSGARQQSGEKRQPQGRSVIASPSVFTRRPTALLRWPILGVGARAKDQRPLGRRRNTDLRQHLPVLAHIAPRPRRSSQVLAAKLAGHRSGECLCADKERRNRCDPDFAQRAPSLAIESPYLPDAS